MAKTKQEFIDELIFAAEDIAEHEGFPPSWVDWMEKVLIEAYIEEL